MFLKPRQSADRGRPLRRFQARALIAFYKVLNRFLAFLSFLLWPRRRPADARSVCIYRTGNVGDLLCALPAICAVHRAYPLARIVLLSTPGLPGLPSARTVLGSVDWIHEFVEYLPAEMFRIGSARRIVKSLRARKFDVFIELPNDMARMRTLARNMIFARATGAKWAWGWTLGTVRVGLQRQSEELEFPDEVDRLLQIVGRCGIETQDIEFRLPLAGAHRNSADTLLRSLGVDLDSPLVAIAFGAKREDNRWPLERFAAVGRELAGSGYQVVAVGSRDERADAQGLCETIGDKCFNLAGRTDIAVAGAILERCRLVVCNDSGIQHLASAVGTPSVAIFSFWQLRGKWYPHHPGAIVLQKQVACHTCYRQSCPFGKECVLGTTSREVTDAAVAVLGSQVKRLKVSSL